MGDVRCSMAGDSGDRLTVILDDYSTIDGTGDFDVMYSFLKRLRTCYGFL